VPALRAVPGNKINHVVGSKRVNMPNKNDLNVLNKLNTSEYNDFAYRCQPFGLSPVTKSINP
jgi:hypothetical protein